MSKFTTGFFGLLYFMKKYPGASFHVYGMNWNFQEKDRKCIGCDKFINDGLNLPKNESTNKKVISE